MLNKNTSIPIHYQIQKILEKDICNGKFMPGANFPSDRELVLRFGVSRGTIRKVLSSMVTDGLIIRKRGQGSYVASVTKNSSDFSQLKAPIGVVMYAPAMEAHGFMFKLWNAINNIAQRDEHNISLIPFTDNNLTSNDYLLKIIQQRKISGVIISAEEVSDEEILLLHENKIPIVLLERYTPNKEIPTIRIDYKNKIFRALRYLKSLGHSRIAYVGNEEKYRVIRECAKYFLEANRFLKLDFNEEYVKMGGKAGSRSVQVVSELLDMKKFPTAIIVQDPFHYVGILNECRQRGIDIPQQLSVISLTEFHLSSILQPTLSSYDINELKMVHFAFKMLDDVLLGKHVESKAFKTKLIKRNSCTRLAKNQSTKSFAIAK